VIPFSHAVFFCLDIVSMHVCSVESDNLLTYCTLTYT